ncbi:MAG: sulfite exporter TauE/SafE family protein [Actinomycetota bacterium]|nr:sulfite exporter TauE/SafE family protein [Actinomycetota bacterium]
MTTGQLVVVAVAVFGAAFVQVIAGFGFALLCMPIMTIAVPVEKAVVISSLLGIMSSVWQAWHQRADADRPLVKRLTLSAFLGMPLGLVVLNVVADRTLKIVLGVAVLIATALIIRRINLTHVGPAMDVGAGFLSGVLNTSLSTNGPPLVFDLQARHLSPARFRATISMVFALSNIVGLALFVADGKVTREGMRAALIALPAWAVGQLLGWPVRKHVHGERFRWMVVVLLFLAGASAIVFAVT